MQPLSLLGQSIPTSLPSLSASLPQKFLYDAVDAASALFGATKSTSTSNTNVDGLDALGFFDVAYLDADILVIRQNQPGGMFISSRLPGADLAQYF